MKTSIITLITFAILSLSSCKKEEVNSIFGNTTQINAFPKEVLNDDELNSLMIMREEEKLAYDVYKTLYNKWGVRIFSNISSSEQTHTTAILTLLKKYELKDPAENKTVGVFENNTLQSLYNQLITQGNTSELAAFKVGATIEDLDIFDLNNWSSKVDNQDIKYVYDNLIKGSRNHMRSFYSQVNNSGGTYTAQYITQSELEAIINSSKETGSW